MKKNLTLSNFKQIKFLDLLRRKICKDYFTKKFQAFENEKLFKQIIYDSYKLLLFSSTNDEI
jgi:hypothetical protein